MKDILWKLLLIFLTASIVESSNDQMKVKTFSNALNTIVRNYYVKNSVKFDFLIYGKKSEKFASAIITNIMKLNPEVVSSELIFLSALDNKDITLQHSMIIFVNSFDHLQQIRQLIIMTNIDFMEYQLTMVLENYEDLDLHYGSFQRIDLEPESPIHNEISLFPTKDNIALYRVESFATLKCSTIMIASNIFFGKNQSWMFDDVSVKQYNQLNGCKLLVSMNTEGTYRVGLGSFVKKSFQLLSHKLNYRVLPTPMGSITSENLYIGFFECNIRNYKISYMFCYTHKEFTFVLRDGDEYTNYEKFVLPFEYETWILCGLFFSTTIVVVVAVNYVRDQRLKNLFYDTRVKSPIFDILIIFFGQSQSAMPRSSSARFFLFNFIMLCFMIRTLYQGYQFDMTYMVRYLSLEILIFKTKIFIIFKAIRRPTPETIDEAMEDGYIAATIAIHQKYLSSFQAKGGYVRLLTDKDTETLKTKQDVDNFFDLKQAYSFERISGSESFSKPFKQIQGTKTNPMKFLRDNFYVGKFGFLFRKTSIFKLFIENFQRLFEAGILKYLHDKEYEPVIVDLEFIDDKILKLDNYETLSLSKLEAGIVIWLVSVLIAIFGFICEILHYNLMKFLKKTKRRRKVKIKTIKVKKIKVRTKSWRNHKMKQKIKKSKRKLLTRKTQK